MKHTMITVKRLTHPLSTGWIDLEITSSEHTGYIKCAVSKEKPYRICSWNGGSNWDIATANNLIVEHNAQWNTHWTEYTGPMPIKQYEEDKFAYGRMLKDFPEIK